jgi:hypothetical protein
MTPSSFIPAGSMSSLFCGAAPVPVLSRLPLQQGYRQRMLLRQFRPLRLLLV